MNNSCCIITEYDNVLTSLLSVLKADENLHILVLTCRLTVVSLIV